METVIKPKREAYVTFHLKMSGVVLLGFGIMMFLLLRCLDGARPYAFIPPVVIWIIAMAVIAFITPIKYRKEEYTLYSDRLVSKGGNVFSSYEKELSVKNITNVSLELKYFEEKFHKTGSITIQSAGSGDVEVKMHCLENPHEVYQQIFKILQQNGFSLKKEQEVRHSSPHKLGVLLETIIVFFATMFAVNAFTFGLPLYAEVVPNTEYFEFYVLFLINIIIVLATTVLTFGRVKNTKYILHSDTIGQESQFLNFTQSTIPMENLSDSTLQQGLIARAIGIYDLTLSCQGGGQEIKYAYITNGNDWKQDLDNVLKNKPKLPDPEPTSNEDGSVNKVKIDRSYQKDDEYTSSFKMDKKRLFMAPVILLVLTLIIASIGVGSILSSGEVDEPTPFQILAIVISVLSGIVCFVSFISLVIGFILHKANTYHIKEQGFAKDFQFINKSNNEYSAEKVTGVIVNEGLFDRIFGACSVQFWSIGSTASLVFSTIHKDDEQIEKIRNKVGIYTAGKEGHDIFCSVNVENFFKQYIFLYGFLLLPVIGLIAGFGPSSLPGLIAAGVYFALAAVPLAFAHLYYSFCKLSLFDDFLVYKCGIIFRKTYYIRYDDIKFVTRTLYPFSQSGSVVFDVTGEQIVQNQENQATMSNRFSVGHIEDADRLLHISDLFIEKKIKASEIESLEYGHNQHEVETMISAQPHVKQFITERFFFLGFLDLIAVGLIVLMFLSEDVPSGVLATVIAVALGLNGLVISLLNLYVKRIHYTVDEEKLTETWGIFYRSKKTLHYLDIDHITKKQGFFNNIFKTGNIDVHTVGSSRVDMSIKNLDDVETFYKLLKTGYQARQ